MSDRFENDPDIFVDQAENADPNLCDSHGHDWWSPPCCRRCGLAMWPTDAGQTR